MRNLYKDYESGGYVLELRGPHGYRSDGTWDDGWFTAGTFGSKASALEFLSKAGT